MSVLAFLRRLELPPAGFCEEESAYLAGDEFTLAKFRHWRGRSGRFYVFSAYAPQDCPAYDNAVLLVASRGDGAGEALDCVDLGALPEVRLAELRRLYGDDVEFQIHVLANRSAERRALIDDLSPARAA